jgi:hypothetical protein
MEINAGLGNADTASLLCNEASANTSGAQKEADRQTLKSDGAAVTASRCSNSSAQLPLGWKIHELAMLLTMKARSLVHTDRLPSVFHRFDQYDQLLRKYSNLELEKAKVFEIGFGQRAGRMIALVSLGIDAVGVDLDVPLLKGTPREIYQIYRRNGLERLIKSLIRFFSFDLIWRRRLSRELQRKGCKLVLPTNRLLAQDAATVELPNSSFDLIISESVFEHIPLSSLKPLITKMRHLLKPTGLALIRPDIFTGISGGHLVEWFRVDATTAQRNSPGHQHRWPAVGERRRRSEPWEHLRKKRFRANVYLNELARADYRRLFSEHFEIVEEQVTKPDLGREFLSPEVAEELKDYGDDELFSNGVLFVLRPKTVSEGDASRLNSGANPQHQSASNEGDV